MDVKDHVGEANYRGEVMDIERLDLHDMGGGFSEIGPCVNGDYVRYSDIEYLIQELDDALAKLAAIESQEPVIRISGGRVVDFNPNYGGSVSEGAFYAKPVPADKPAVAVSYSTALVKLSDLVNVYQCLMEFSYSSDYANDVLRQIRVAVDAMLEAAPSHSQQSEQANQCDGCMAGMALKEGNLHTDYSGNVVMVCQSDRYRVEQGGEV